METKYQKTVAKFITKTKVVNYDGSKPTFSDVIRRTICRIIPFDSISFLFSANGFHDSLSSTKVVKDENLQIFQSLTIDKIINHFIDKSKETFETWNKIAKVYEDKFMKLDLYNETYDFVCQSIKKEHAKILEIGCGPGNITKYLLNKRSDFNIHEIDVAPNMIALAAKNNPTASFAVMDARKINNFSTKFDGIIAGFCIPYFSSSESEQFIADAHHLLNDNGLIYVSFVEGSPLQSGFKTNSYGDKVYFHYHELEALKALLHANRFEDLNIFKVDFKKSATEADIHTILIARKNKE